MSSDEFSTSEMQRHFFEDACTVKVEIEVFEDQHQDALRAFRANHWRVEEGYRIALSTGLGKLSADQMEEEDDAEVHMPERLMRLESLYAVMKFNAFHLMRDNQTLEMQTCALRNTISALEGALERAHAETNALRSRLGEPPTKWPSILIEQVPSLTGIRSAIQEPSRWRAALSRSRIGRSGAK